MVSQDLLYRLRDTINSFPELAGCRIGFQGNHQSRMLSAGNPNSANYRIIILIEETDEDLGLQGNVNQAPIAAPEKVLNKTRLWPELAGAGLLCGAATWSGIGVLGGAAAEPATGGRRLLWWSRPGQGLLRPCRNVRMVSCGSGRFYSIGMATACNVGTAMAGIRILCWLSMD